MVDETRLILDAIQRSSPVRRRRKRLREIEPTVIEEGPDALTKLAKKQLRDRSSAVRRRRKGINQWTSTDFLKYLIEMLSPFGINIPNQGVRDRDILNKLYDLLADSVHDRMDNTVLKEYLEWWVSSYAPFCVDRSIAVDRCVSVQNVKKFASRFQCCTDVIQHNKSQDNVDASTLFDLGGLSMVLVSKGIVLSYQIMKNKQYTNILSKISSTLRDLSKDDVQQSMENTFSNSPYDSNDKIDFVTIAKDALVFHGLKHYLTVSYQEYFK